MKPQGSLGRKLRMGLIGGGQGSFIGRVHAMAAGLDLRAELVAGALSSNSDRARESAADYGIAPERAYGSYHDLFAAESKLPPERRIHFVSIATPNHTHFPIAMAAVQAGFDVVCDKPMTLTFGEAEQLVAAVEASGVVFALTHNYTGYPLVRQAREMVRNGDLGQVQAIRVNYIQGWLRTRLETSDHKQAAWRTDPARTGSANCFGDIGTHAFNLARYISGMIPEAVSCHLKSFEAGRTLDDYGTAVLRFEQGALVTLTASQISHGRENDLSIEIDGTKASMQWRQEDPNVLVFRQNGQPHRLYSRDPKASYTYPVSRDASRLICGHPEGFFEAFANLYRDAYDAMVLRARGEAFETVNTIYPNVYDGAEGMLFIRQCVASSNAGGEWTPLVYPRARR